MMASPGARDGKTGSAGYRDMILIQGDTFRMGSDHHNREEAPTHNVTVGSFWLDRYPVTESESRRFVGATGYISLAEIAPAPKDYPDVLPHMLHPGSLVFTSPDHHVHLRDWSQW